MRGFLASQFPSDEGEYSDLQVMKSAAGYYIGTTFTHNDRSACAGMVEPGSRESGYYRTENDAIVALEAGMWEQRLSP